MMKRLNLLAPVALCALTACSGTEAPTKTVAASKRQSFSAESKRVARSLSIGAERGNLKGSPQFRAALCSLALKVIEERLRQGVALSAEQERAFAQAQALYERRAAAGLTPDERQKTMSAVEAAYPEEGDRARFAIACLRDMT